MADYNREKDRVTIEKIFEAPLKLVQNLTEEETRAIREGLDEETLAIFDILKKPDLTAADIQRIKKVAVDLLHTLRKKNFASITGGIRNPVFLKTTEVFQHVYRVYRTIPSPFYSVVSAN